MTPYRDAQIAIDRDRARRRQQRITVPGDSLPVDTLRLVSEAIEAGQAISPRLARETIANLDRYPGGMSPSWKQHPEEWKRRVDLVKAVAANAVAV